MREDRLEVAAKFLESMPVAKFSYETLAVEGGKPMLEALAAGEFDCGTVGCAIGWMPAMFPGEVEWRRVRWSPSHKTVICLGKEDAGTDPYEVAAAFFELTLYEAQYLFIPGENYLPLDATPTQVAGLIRDFMKNGIREPEPEEEFPF